MENIPPSICYNTISTQKVQIKFFMFQKMFIFTHEFTQFMELKKLKLKKMVVVVLLFSTFGTWEDSVVRKYTPPPFIIVSFPHIKSKSIFFYSSRCSYSHMNSHNS